MKKVIFLKCKRKADFYMDKVFLFIWRLLDPFYFLFTRLDYIKYGENVFRVRLTSYKGYSITLSDGTTINKNDLLLKIHFHNVKLLSELNKIQDDFQKAKRFYHTVKKSLPDLATYIQNHPQGPDIKALIGITSLNIGSNRLGFETYSIKNRYYKKIKWIAFLPINILSGLFMNNKKKNYEPVYIFMGKETLFNKHLKIQSETEQHPVPDQILVR